MKSIYRFVRSVAHSIVSTKNTSNITTAILSELLESTLLTNPKRNHPKSLLPYRRKIYSQFGQDGMIEEIYRRIGTDSKRFIEIGTSTSENNTNLLLLNDWSGLWVDLGLPADHDLPDSIAGYQRDKTLTISRSRITRDNSRSIIEAANFGTNVDLLSIDIDLNTYHILEQLINLQPRVLVVEYNGCIPGTVDWVFPYDSDAMWDGSFRFGSSLSSLSNLARRSGYTLVGCELSGTDAFFVRDDLIGDCFLEPNNVSFHWEPLRIHLDQKCSHTPLLLPKKVSQ